MLALPCQLQVPPEDPSQQQEDLFSVQKSIKLLKSVEAPQHYDSSKTSFQRTLSFFRSWVITHLPPPLLFAGGSLFSPPSSNKISHHSSQIKSVRLCIQYLHHFTHIKQLRCIPITSLIKQRIFKLHKCPRRRPKSVLILTNVDSKQKPPEKQPIDLRTR